MTRLLLALLTWAATWTVGLGSAAAHEVRPAYLQIEETGGGEAVVVWKQPAQGDVALRLRPTLSNGWLDAEPADQYAAGGYIVRTWRVRDAGSVAGVRIRIHGLEHTITDVLVRVQRQGAPDYTAIVRPQDPTVTVPDQQATGSQVAFLVRGVGHILTGADHLLFVLGLLLIVPGRRALVLTVTAFTVAHSLTLAAATLGYLKASIPLVETLVALSIVFLAAEVVRAQRGGSSLTLRCPWIVAFLFGLLHGTAFASALAGLELPSGELAGALLLFNLGVEAGQLAFVALVFALWRGLQRSQIRWLPAARLVPAYAIGGLGAFWTLQNAIALFATGA